MNVVLQKNQFNIENINLLKKKRIMLFLVTLPNLFIRVNYLQ